MKHQWQNHLSPSRVACDEAHIVVQFCKSPTVHDAFQHVTIIRYMGSVDLANDTFAAPMRCRFKIIQLLASSPGHSQILSGSMAAR